MVDIEHSREASVVDATNECGHAYLVGVVDVPDEGVDPVLVIRRGPHGPEVSQRRRSVEEVRVVEVLLGVGNWIGNCVGGFL